MKKLSKLFICAVILTSFLTHLKAEEKIDLKLKLDKCDKFKMTMVQDQQISQNFNGMTMDINQHQEMIMFSEVTDVDDEGVMTIKTTYGDMKMKMDMPQMSFEFDTANPDPNMTNNPQIAPMVKIFSALKEASIYMKVDKTGKTVSIDGMDAMIDSMCDKISQTDPNAGEGIKDMMKSFVNEDKVQEMSNGIFSSFPQGKVAVGDVWDTIMTMGTEQFPMSLDTTCVLKEINDGIAVIDLTAKMDMGADGGKVVEQGGMKMNMLLTGVMNGSQQVDIDTGWMTQSQMQQSFSGTMKMEPNQHMPDGMSIPMTIKGKVTIVSEKI